MSNLRKDKRIAKWNKLTLRNNFMFRLVMEKQELCKKLIECILGIKLNHSLLTPRRLRREIPTSTRT
ncbi:MAG: hypothetical protein ACI3U2_00830, partial [Anaerovibrio sp.]